jgi:hypothetical protein
MPRLIDTLEQRYGRQLDEWLEAGRFTSSSWTLSPQFQVSEERARCFVTNVVTDAFDGGAIAVYERCGEGLRLFVTRALTETLNGLPTHAAERELIETVMVRRPTDAPRRRQAAVEAAAFSSASPLPGPAKALLELRYGTDYRHLTECWEGEIDPVWREVAELLPPEVAALIPDEGTGE